MLEINKKIIFYLSFAKSKLDKKCKEHEKAREEIDEIIKQLGEWKQMNINQRQKILDYIQKWGAITSYEAYLDLRYNTISNKNKWVKRARIWIYRWMDNKEESWWSNSQI